MADATTPVATHKDAIRRFAEERGWEPYHSPKNLVMALASVGIGLIPPFERIGIWAPVLLVVLRVVQGVAVGGEWGGATLMAAEHSRSRRGMWASMVNAGAPIGLVLSTLVLSITAARTTEKIAPCNAAAASTSPQPRSSSVALGASPSPAVIFQTCRKTAPATAPAASPRSTPTGL